MNEIEKRNCDHNHDKYVTTPEFNKLTPENFAAAILAQVNLASKSDIANFAKKTDLDDKLKDLNKYVTSNKRKHLVGEKELKILQRLDASLFIVQSYLTFQPICKTISLFPGF